MELVIKDIDLGSFTDTIKNKLEKEMMSLRVLKI